MMAADRPRLFVAIELPDTVRQTLRDATAPWRASLTDFRWSAPDALHVTVVFIGHVEADDVGTIGSAIGSVVQQHPPVPTGLTRFGTFPEGGRPRVLWVGLDDPADALGRLAGGVASALAGFLDDPEERPYHPHITIARARRPSSVPPALFEGQVPALRWTIDAVTLVRSHLGGDAPRYEPIDRWTLQAGTLEVP